MILTPGQPAPPIQLEDVLGRAWNLQDHAGKMVCLYFARGEYCPTTRGEFALWNSFARLYPKMNCVMAFVVNGGREEHARFCREFRMTVPILLDADGSVGESYGLFKVNHHDLKRDDYPNYVAPAVQLIDASQEIAGSWVSNVPRGMPTPETIFGILAYAEHNNWKY